MVGVKMDRYHASLFKASIAMIIDVTVVPILAPIMTPTDCFKVMIPAFTKPTTITVVALLL